MSKLLGIVTLFVGGDKLRSVPGATLDPGGVKRTPRAVFVKRGWRVDSTGAVQRPDSLTEVHYTEESVHAEVEAEIVHDSTTNVAKLSNLGGVTVRFECDTGQSYLVSNAFVTEPCKIKGGNVSLKMAGQPAEME